jgi:glucose/arabinose dehydrogenase
VTSSNVTPKLTVFASGLDTPWGMAFLPDGRLLVTQKAGSLVLVSADGTTKSTISGAPPVDASGQGGLLDVALDPQFSLANNRRIYLAFSEPGMNGTNGTAVARADLNAGLTALENVTVIFQQLPKKVSSGHYGSRIIFRPDGTMFVTLGERQMPINATNEAQSLTSLLGKVVRITTAGAPAPGNPYITDANPLTRFVWSYGHRNPQAAALHPTTGELWVTEHGPQGGDEVNLSLAGRNFGWPAVSYGCNYGDPVGTACRIGGGTHKAPYTPPVAYWYPTSTAPGGAMFYTGARFPEWQGNLLVGGLAGRTLYRFVINGNAIVGQEPFFAGQHEVRDLKQGPDGWIYMISRNTNQIHRIER